MVESIKVTKEYTYTIYTSKPITWSDSTANFMPNLPEVI